jgi:hypothetical protein
MNTLPKTAVLILASLASAAVIAQTPPAPTSPTTPSAASSPHQRDVTSTPATEQPTTKNPDPAAAATPHQKEVTDAGKTGHKDKQQAMKDCMAKEQGKNSTATKDEMKKACAQQMSKPSAPTE